MRLSEALRVRQGDVVSFVGAGGKTTAMVRLGRELAGQGWRVIVTTTTHIRPPTLHDGESLVVRDDSRQALELTRQTLRCNSLVTVAARLLPAENKLEGVPRGWISSFLPVADIVLIEADGAKMLPLKAPAAHEPVIPAETSLLVPVVGIDAVGLELRQGMVHRPDLVAALTGLSLGEIITPAAVAALLVHPEGALKGAPESARAVALINKVEGAAALETAHQVAARIQSAPALERVLIGAVARDDPVVECWRRVSAVVLAAGGAARLGRTKQLLPVGGTTMIERVLRTVMNTTVDEVIVVLGHEAAKVAAHVPEGCRAVVNPAWQDGMSTSIGTGLDALNPRSEAALFVLADQPRMGHAVLQRILYAYYGTLRGIVAPEYRGQLGAPALFDRRMFPALHRLRGDVGGREVIRQFADEVLTVEMESAEPFRDVDTAADYQQLRKQLGENGA